MPDYHAHVFKNGKPDHDFEAMYANEELDGYDSWRQGDLRHARVQLALAMLAPYNFAKILDIGCGKGAVTHLLKRANNYVVGVDGSSTAIKKARASYPDIQFACCDALTAVEQLPERFDLITAQCVFAYIAHWRSIVEAASRSCTYFLCVEYVPKGTIGAVGTIAELVSDISYHFSIVRKVVLDDEVVIILGKSHV